jgi:hypothetical protein
MTKIILAYDHYRANLLNDLSSFGMTTESEPYIIQNRISDLHIRQQRFIINNFKSRIWNLLSESGLRNKGSLDSNPKGLIYPPLIFVLVLCLVSRCSPQIIVHHDYDTSYELADFKTYNWGNKKDVESQKNPRYYSELNDKRIKSAVNNELNLRGYMLAETFPELLVHYHIVVDDRSVLVTEPYGYVYGLFWEQLETHIYSYREGTLIIDVIETKTNELVWRAWAAAPVENLDTPKKIDVIVKKAVSKMFREFPESKINMKAEKGLVVK